MPRFVSLAGLVTLALIVVAAPGHAQSSTTRGLSLGLSLQGASLAIEGGDAQGGGGAGIRIGYGFNRRFTGFLRSDVAEVEVDDRGSDIRGDWRMAHVELGLRFHFANSLRRWVPYLEAAVGGRAVEVDNARVSGDGDIDRVDFNGSVFSLGGGLGLHFTQTLALDVGVAVGSGEFNEIDIGTVAVQGLDLDATSVRLNLGLTWWP